MKNISFSSEGYFTAASGTFENETFLKIKQSSIDGIKPLMAYLTASMSLCTMKPNNQLFGRKVGGKDG